MSVSSMLNFPKPVLSGTPCFMERLEPRRLLSAVIESQSTPPTDATTSAIDLKAFQDAFRRHTLTPEQMAADDLVSMNWQGQEIYAKAGEWILGFRAKSPIYDADGNLIDLNVDWAGPSVQAPELQAKFDQAGLGVKFVQYLGSKDAVLIHVPETVSFEQLQASLQGLDRFQGVEPNGVFMFDDDLITPPQPQSSPGASTAAPLLVNFQPPKPWGARTAPSGSTRAQLNFDSLVANTEAPGAGSLLDKHDPDDLVP